MEMLSASAGLGRLTLAAIERELWAWKSVHFFICNPLPSAHF